MKQDIYGHEGRYKNWKEHVLKNGEDSLTKDNSKILLKYIFDMEIGANVSIKSKKGARGYHRLNALRQKVCQVFKHLQERGVSDITKIKKEELQKYFDDMRKGEIKTHIGGTYKSVTDYVKAFKSFWHWWIKINYDKNKVVKDITEYVASNQDIKPVWVYLDEKQIQKLIKESSPKYASFFEFQLDSGARVTEALSLLGRDVYEDKGIVFANISPEIAKSSGRKIKLLLCGKNILQYKKDNDIKEDELLFPLSAPYINRYLNELGKKLFGEVVSKGGEKFSKLTLYDFRHNSCCYWLPRYKTESALMYKFGWKTSKYIHYYSEFLGMKDTIRNEDLYVDITKTELENEIKKLKEGMKKQTHIYSTEMERAITDMERTKAMLHEFTSELAKKTGIDLNTLKQMVKN